MFSLNNRFSQNLQLRYLLKKLYEIPDSIINVTEIVCVTHFAANDFINLPEGSKRILKEGAVPTAYLEEMHRRYLYYTDSNNSLIENISSSLFNLGGNTCHFNKIFGCKRKTNKPRN